MEDNATYFAEKEGILLSGYDLPVYGLDNGSFYYIHIPALLCIFSSFCCVVAVLILSFRSRNYKTFFRWTKSERFIVYIAICDGSFNVAHSVDHLHYVIAQNHVRPKELCEFYGFTLAEFITAQIFLVNIVAINAFLLMYFNRNLKFGKYDWRLLTWTFGVPFVGATAAAISGQFGPSGSFCFFDGVKGGTAYICFTTVPLSVIMLMNCIMYILTWKRIKQQTSQLEHTLESQHHHVKTAQRAARTMSMFVAAFFIQWWALFVFSVWALITVNIPQAMIHIVTTFSNIGGCLNLGVYVIMRRRSLTGGQDDSGDVKPCTKTSKVTSDSGHGTTGIDQGASITDTHSSAQTQL